MFYVLAPFRFLFKLYFGLVFFIVLLVQYPIYFILTRSPKTANVIIFLKRYVWTSLMQIFMLVGVYRLKKTKLGKGPYIICPNHSSYYDIVLMYRFIPGKVIFMGKSELKKWPLLNVFFKNGNFHIAVDRKNPIDAKKALSMAEKRIDEGKSIVIFPEGTIPDNAPVLNRFKSGAFKLAIEKQIPVVPVTFLDNWRLMSDPVKLFGPCRPGIARAIIHEPIETKGMTEKDVLSLQQRVHAIIENDLNVYIYPIINKRKEWQIKKSN